MDSPARPRPARPRSSSSGRRRSTATSADAEPRAAWRRAREPATGQTPRQEIYRRNKSRLYRYESSAHATAPRCSSCPTSASAGPTSSTSCPAARFIEHMTQRGVRLLPPRLGRLRPGGQRPHLRGLRGEDPAAHGREGPGDLGRARALGARLLHGRAAVGLLRGVASRDPGPELRQHGGPDRLLARSGCSGSGSTASTSTSTGSSTRWAAVPADMVKAGFKLLKPTMDLSTNLNLWWNLVERQVRRGASPR